MAGKLLSISRNPRSISALKGGFVFFLALRFLADPSWEWGALYVFLAAIFYSRPIFNISGTFPLFSAIISLPFFLRPDSFPFQFLLAFSVAVSYVILLGVKNLALTHREWWTHCVSYFVSYLFFLSFFGASSPSFVLSWVFAFIFLYCVFRTVIPDRHVAMIVTLFAAETLWIVSWLPVGYLSSANFMLLITLFLSDVAHEGKVTLRNQVLFPVLSFVIAASSYWQL